MVGTACCTFIPDESNNITDAFHVVARLRGAMAKDYHPQPEDPWTTWLTFCPWWHLMMKILTPILAVLLLFCLFTSCVVPCLREMIKRTMTQTLIAYQAISHGNIYSDAIDTNYEEPDS